MARIILACILRGAKDEHNRKFFDAKVRPTARVFNTSTIAGIDLGDGLVVTKHSIYRIGEQGQGEPDSDLILYACNVLHRMGVGEMFGVLDIFY